MRDSADKGSPWAPVTTSTSCSSGRSGTPLVGIEKLGGSLAMPRSRAISMLLARDLPLMTTVRPRSRARSKTSWMRWMWLENSVTTMRPGASSKTLPKDSMTARSVRERPSRSTLVESENSRRAPCGPAKSRKVAKSVPLPARGWGSILKSRCGRCGPRAFPRPGRNLRGWNGIRGRNGRSCRPGPPCRRAPPGTAPPSPAARAPWSLCSTRPGEIGSRRCCPRSWGTSHGRPRCGPSWPWVRTMPSNLSRTPLTAPKCGMTTSTPDGNHPGNIRPQSTMTTPAAVSPQLAVETDLPRPPRGSLSKKSFRITIRDRLFSSGGATFPEQVGMIFAHGYIDLGKAVQVVGLGAGQRGLGRGEVGRGIQHVEVGAHMLVVPGQGPRYRPPWPGPRCSGPRRCVCGPPARPDTWT